MEFQVHGVGSQDYNPSTYALPPDDKVYLGRDREGLVEEGMVYTQRHCGLPIGRSLPDSIPGNAFFLPTEPEHRAQVHLVLLGPRKALLLADVCEGLLSL